MSEPEFETDVARMLRRRAADIPDAESTGDSSSAVDAEGSTIAQRLSPSTADHREGRRRGLVAAAALLIFAAALAATVLARGDSETTTTGPRPTTDIEVLGPRPPQLPPVDADPVVSCDPWRDQWYRYSALSGPTGAENDPDPAATALREHLAWQALVTASGVPPLGLPTPTSAWRRLATSETRVLFGAGDLPLLSFKEAELRDGTWQVSGGNAGTCHQLWVRPAVGLSPASWYLGEAPGPQATELQLDISVFAPSLMLCGDPQLGLDELVGPDVIETDETVTIRVATRRPLRTPETDPDCLAEAGRRGDWEPPAPLQVTVALQSPLGDRRILDGNLFPAPEVDTVPEEPEPDTAATDAPEVEFPGGTEEVAVMVQVNDQNICDLRRPETCTISVQPATLSITAQGETRSVDTNSMGAATMIVPEGPIEIAADANEAWCPRTLFAAGDTLGAVAINCTRLNLPHATVSGVASSESAGAPASIVFRRVDQLPRSVTVLIDDDGQFEAILEPGTWYVSGSQPAGGVSPCPVGDRPPFTIETEVDLTLDIGCL